MARPPYTAQERQAIRVFGFTLQRLRKSADMTQAGLAEKLGTSRRSVYDVERGKRRLPGGEQGVVQIADALGLPEGSARRCELMAVSLPTPTDKKIKEVAAKEAEQQAAILMEDFGEHRDEVAEDQAYKALVKAGMDKDRGGLEGSDAKKDIDWVYRHMEVPVTVIDVKTVPSAGAVTLFRQAVGNKIWFLEKFWVRLIPTKSVVETTSGEDEEPESVDEQYDPAHLISEVLAETDGELVSQAAERAENQLVGAMRDVG